MIFIELWEGVPEWKKLFRNHNITSQQRAYDLWSNRYPRLVWTVCGVDGCSRLVVEGDRCINHVAASKRLPTWQWYKSELYRLLSFRHGQGGCFPGHDYQPYILHVAQQRHGPLEPGFWPHRIDKNFLNLRPANVVVLSHVSRAAVDAGRCSVADGIEIDARIGDVVNNRTHRPRSIALVGHAEIARASGMSASGVRSAAARGRLDMADPASVLRFVADRESQRVRGAR